jgi:hypothetical protein
MASHPPRAFPFAAHNASRSNKATSIEPLGRVARRITCVQTFFLYAEQSQHLHCEIEALTRGLASQR